jgi:hypothetical protein
MNEEQSRSAEIAGPYDLVKPESSIGADEEGPLEKVHFYACFPVFCRRIARG